MKQLFLMVSDGSVKLLETPAPTVKENDVIVETEYSVVSAGTERSLVSFGGKGLLQKIRERPDQAKKVLEKMAVDGVLSALDAAFTRLSEPMPMGYSGVGTVTACGRGVTDVSVGDRVAMAGQAYHAEVNRVNRNLIARLPADAADIRQYAMCALGGIALQGIHQANVVPGETVAVIGLGLVGHITARILNAYGCDVIAYDIADKTLPGTRLKAFVRASNENAADITKAMTNGRGADKVIITAAADSNMPMDLAAAIVRDRGVICMIGVTQMKLDRRPYYERELTFTMARSYGPGRYDPAYEEKGVDYPVGQVRFTEGRNIEEFVRLVSEGRADFTDLITHVFPFDEAERAYALITANSSRERSIGVLLQYPKREEKWAAVIKHSPGKTSEGKLRVGLIGAGSFSKGTLLPVLQSTGLYQLRALATTGGTGAAQASHSFGFEYVTSDYRRLLDDAEIDLIVVSTRHNTHAQFIIEALEAGKHVCCEKPLCLTIDELERIIAAYRSSPGELFCGLNRRYAPLVQKVRETLSTDQTPAVYDYIVNAGFIRSDHWAQDEAVGGGRIIGEACHFVDTIQYLDGSRLESLNITHANHGASPQKDNALIALRFSSGAIANIVYTSMGSRKYPKEQLRVFSNGAVCELDNFIRLRRYGCIRAGTVTLRQDKGIAGEYAHIAAVLAGRLKNDAIEDAFLSHRLILEGNRDG